MATVLIIEDDPAMRRGLRDNFRYHGYEVHEASDGNTAMEMAVALRPDLIVLDVMLPHANGYEICRYLRGEKIPSAILMLTAKSEEEDVVHGLKVGADDYVSKPFSLRELLARAEALIRRNVRPARDAYAFGDLILEISSRSLSKGGVEIKLSPKEFDLLRFLLEHQGKAVSRDEIMNHVWGWEHSVTSRSVDRFITTLRNKVEPEPDSPKYIQTVREFGYKFVMPTP